MMGRETGEGRRETGDEVRWRPIVTVLPPAALAAILPPMTDITQQLNTALARTMTAGRRPPARPLPQPLSPLGCPKAIFRTQ